MPVQPVWSLSDLLDLEFFLEEDRKKILAGQEEELHCRDRRIYQEIKQDCPADDAGGQASCLLHRWLARRRQMITGEQDTPLPGQLFAELIRIATWLFFGVALASGWGTTVSYLSYQGVAPINVAAFLTIFVLSQLFFLVLLLFFLFAGRLRTRPPLPLTYGLVRRGLLLLLKKLGRLANSRSSQWLRQLSGNMYAHGDLYGLLFMLPVFLLVQLAVVAFNLGVEAALIFKVMTTDLAFGWQTTLQTGAEAVARLVKIIALPWSWLLPAGTGYPDLAQIEGSHIILKEGIRHLQSTALTSWWPFLFLSVAVYGLLPRLLLYAGGRITLKRLLKKFRFDSAAHQQLLQRMHTPILTTSARQSDPASVTDSPEEDREPQQQPDPIPGKALLLVPEELTEEYAIETLHNAIGRQTGYRDITSHVCDLYDEVYPARVQGETEMPVLIVQEAWQPPINEFLHVLKRLREELGSKTRISVFLIGRAEQEAELAPPRQRDRVIWMRKIAALGDPRLDVLSLYRP